MNAQRRYAVYTIAPEQGFIDTLARGLLTRTEGKREDLSRYRILLPTRRACRALREAFLRQTNGEPLLLPLMTPLGDIDEDELFIKMPDIEALDIPPAISPLHRQVFLARTIAAIEDFNAEADQAMALAKALGQFMDQIIIEGLSLDVLHSIVPEEFAEHWQITVNFLKILSEEWPKILDAYGFIDAAERRNRLVHALNRHWQCNPPAHPVIAAGSTGTVPATRALMKTIAGLPQGEVILPGLDRDIDIESWAAIDDAHPQHSLKVLLNSFELEPLDVKDWSSGESASERSRLLREIMRPAETASRWKTLNAGAIKGGCDGLEYYGFETRADEALAIAMILRETIEDADKTAALVSADRDLARRVALICRRWGIVIDDSGGRALNGTYRGSFAKLGLRAVLDEGRPVSFLSLVRHGLFRPPGVSTRQLTRIISHIDKSLFRGKVTYSDIKDITDNADNCPDEVKSFTRQMLEHFEPLAAMREGKSAPTKIIKAHIRLLEEITSQENGESIWQDEDGEALAALFAELLALAKDLPEMSLATYGEVIGQLMAQVTIRPAYGTHPRLMILGQLEARMVQADVMVLGGLNEGVWPPDVGHDPWMSRPMRKTYGLPSMDMRVGLSAHDFGQCFCSARVIMTRAGRKDNAPSVPSRWLSRLDTVLKAGGMSLDALSTGPYPQWVKAVTEAPETLRPYQRPAPKPPAAKRPKMLYVTAIENWVRDPYAVYAKYILDLRKPDDLERDIDAAMRGSLIHAIFDKFVREHPDTLPPNSAQILMDYTVEALGQRMNEPGFWAFWQPRFARMIDWFLDHETEWRQNYTAGKTEIEGTYILPNTDFELRANADRIDRDKTGAAAIIDYKTGAPPTASDVYKGLAPQLPLEALIARNNGFEDLSANDVAYMGFWRISGGTVAGEERQIKPPKDKTLQDLIDEAEAGLAALVARFDDDNTPYYSLPRPDAAPAFQDYAHLARVKEWAALDDSAEDAA